MEKIIITKEINGFTVGKEYLIITDKGHKVIVKNNKGEDYSLPNNYFDRVRDEPYEVVEEPVKANRRGKKKEVAEEVSQDDSEDNEYSE